MDNETIKVIYIDYKRLNDMLDIMDDNDISHILKGRRVVAMDDSTYKFFEENNSNTK